MFDKGSIDRPSMTDQFIEHAAIANDEQLTSLGWPANFDFNTDPVCQTVFKPYIEQQLKILEAYDNARDLKSDYLFYPHALDAADDVKMTCQKLGLGDKVANNMFWAMLIHDLGKPELPPEIWDYEDSPPDEVKKQKRQHVTLGADKFAADFAHISHPFKTLALDVIKNHHERLDGKGENKLTAEYISMPVRLASIVEDYDGRTHLRQHHIDMGLSNDPPSVFARMEDKCKGWFDPDLYNAFKAVKVAEFKRAQKNIPDFIDDEPAPPK